MSTFRPLIKAIPIENPHSTSRISEGFCKLHQSWYEKVIKPPEFEYQAIPIEPLPEPKVVPYNNDFNLTEEDKKQINNGFKNELINYDPESDKNKDDSLSNQIKNDPEIKQIKKIFIRSEKVKCLDQVGIDLHPISNFVSGPREPIYLFDIPKAENTDIYLKVSIENVSLPDSKSQLPGIQGMIFLMDSAQRKTEIQNIVKESASDPAFFAFQNDKPVFLQTAQQVTFFQMQKPIPTTMMMVCVLFTENTTDESKDSSLSIPSPTPYAFSYLLLCEGDSKKQFNNNWTKFDSSDSFKNIGQPPPEENSVILNGTISTEFIYFDGLPPTCLNIDNNRNKPLLCLPSSPRITDPIASFFISGIQVLFNNAPKGEYIYFKLFLCLNQTDPFKPEGIKCIASRGVDLLLDTYSSFPIISGKKVYFPDIIRILIENPLPNTAHLIFHVYSISKNASSLHKIAILPLFSQDGTLVQNNLITIPVTPMKRIKSEDYLSKIKSSSKTNIMINFRFPLFLYPPKCFAESANALIPQQFQWNLILSQASQETLIFLAIPIVAKIFSLISQDTVENLFDFLYRFKNFDIKSTIRNWVYTNFDPKTIKPGSNFTSSFANALEPLIQKATDTNRELAAPFSYSFDLVTDILLISYQQTAESKIVLTPIFKMFNAITRLICSLLMEREKEICVSLNKDFSLLLFKFRTMCDDPGVFKALSNHLRFLIQLNHNESFFCVFNFLQVFAVTNEFAIFVASQLPVQQLKLNIMFSPFHPIISLICLAINKTMTAGDERTLVECIKFLNQLFLPLELIPNTRIGFAFFPILDIISSFYASDLMKDHHYDLIPTILFLLGYSPKPLLYNFFYAMSPNFQTLFIEFLSTVTEAMISRLTPEITVLNGLFDQLTQRVIQFLYINLNNFEYSISSVIKLISLFFSPHQARLNYPKIFDVVSQLIKIYPCQRLLAQNLLEVMKRKQSVARCFATSSILLFFKADFDDGETVTISSVEVIDALTTSLLRSPIKQISIYKQMINRIKVLSSYFKNKLFSSKLNERMNAQYKIAEVIEKLRKADQSPDERAAYVMQIANQHRTFPSMRMKWLKEIVRINVNSNNFVSAYIAQLHICALIATVFIHEDVFATAQTDNNNVSSETKSTSNKNIANQQANEEIADFDYNLVICQPIRNARTKGGRGKYMLSKKDFSFNTGVLVETEIDFNSISKDFKFISSDFTIELLKQNLEEAIELGEKSQLYYDLRCLYSLQMRIFAAEHDYKELAKISKGLSNSFHNLTATTSQTHDTALSFFKVNERIYCVGTAAESDFKGSFPNAEVVPVVKHDPTIMSDVKYEAGQLNSNLPKETEHLHCWNAFLGIVTQEDLEKVTDPDKEEIVYVQYTTKEYLPRFVRYSEIIQDKKITVSLSYHVKNETNKLIFMICQASTEFEKCFPCRQINQIEGDYKQKIERDMNRIVSLFEMALKGNDSIFKLLKFLRSKGKEDEAHKLALFLRAGIEKLLKIYHRAIEYLQSPDHYLIFKEMRELSLAFTNDFKLMEIDSKSYEGKRDPLTEHIEYF